MQRSGGWEWFIQPYGYAWCLWSGLVVLLSLYELLMVPIVVAWPFLANPGMYVWDYVVDALFLLDLVMLFYVAQTPHTYYLVTDRTTLVLGYAWGWFMVDAVACMPLDLFVWAANGTTARDFTRLLKLIHIFRLYRALHLLAMRVKERWNTYNEKWILYNPNIERFGALVLFIYLICSIAGCFYFLYSFTVGFGSTFFAVRGCFSFSLSFVDAIAQAPVSLLGASFGTQYLYGFFWAFYTLFGFSLLAQRPVAIGEIFFALVMGIIGLSILVALVAGARLCVGGVFSSQQRAELANLLHVMDAHRARWMEAQQRLNFSQKRKEVQQWLLAMLNAEPLLRGLDPAVIRALAIRCKFKVGPLLLAVAVWPSPPLDC